MTPKVWWKSKTVWYNALTVLVFFATYFFGYQPDDVVSHNLDNVVTNPIFILVVNFALRLITKNPVSLTSPQFPTIDGTPTGASYSQK